MDKTNVIVGGSNVNGNIGDCKVNSETFQKSLFYSQTTAVNSCSGEVISSEVIWDSGWLFFGLICIIVFLFAIKL